MTSENKLWGGRFSSGTDPLLEMLNRSLPIDRRLYAEDIEGSQAYAKSLCQISLLTKEECTSICEGLERIKKEWENCTIELKQSDEDVHTVNERRLKELIGLTATKLHVGRSRNDQIATDIKLWLRKNVKYIQNHLEDLVEAILNRALDEIDVLMPGYTHLQRAQPVRWSHWILSYAWIFHSSHSRLTPTPPLTLPLGSGALAGNPFPVNRLSLASALGFLQVSGNSMAAVGDRDCVADALHALGLLATQMSRLAEDLVLFASREFGYVDLGDGFSTGSSLMPQKRNPDAMELVRGGAGYVFAQYSGFMMTMKSLPSTYNKDLQYDKEYLFNAFDKIEIMLKVSIGSIKTLQVNSKNCQNALSYDMLATDLAYYLVRKDVPFRQAHHIAGQVVTAAEKKGILIHDLTLEELKGISQYFEADVSKVWNFENSVEQYQAIGGTSRSSVLHQISTLQEWLNSAKKTAMKCT